MIITLLSLLSLSHSVPLTSLPSLRFLERVLFPVASVVLTTVQGFVSDANAYAMGGVSGHAGLFANVPDTIKLTATLAWARLKGYVNATTCVLSHGSLSL